jgi:chromosome segregation ATPase
MQRALDKEKAAVKAAAKGKLQKKKMLMLITQKLTELSQETAQAEQLKTEWQDKMAKIKQDLTATQGDLNANSKQMDKCVRDREVLSQKHMNKIDAIKGKELALKIKRSTLKNIKNEHQGYLVSIRNLTRIIENLKRDKAVHEADLNKRRVQKARALEEVAERELKISQFQQQILVNESKLRQQQNLLEAVRSDRNLYRKSLIEQKNEMQEFKRKYSNLNMQIKQLKQEISEKDIGFVTEHFSLEQVKQEIKNFKTKNDKLEQEIKNKEQIIKNSTLKIRKLTTIIADADEELRVQSKQFNSIVNEQRVLNQQLIKRNEELAALYEQLKLQNSELNKGKAHYSEKLAELSQLKANREQLIQSLDDMMNDMNKYEELKATISHLDNELIAEKLKTKALTDELKKPINIHRWRQLMDTNTDTYGMIKRVRILQKQIITKSSEVESKDASIQEKEKLYVDLRKVLARQPGSEAAEQLRLYAATLREKKAKFKQMKSELKMYQAKVYEYKYELQKLAQDLQMVKLDYFSMRRKENMQHARLQQQQQMADYGMEDDDIDDQPIQPYQGVPPSDN